MVGTLQIDQLPPQVLIVDDSTVDRMMLSAVLKKEGFSVITAVNGEEGRTKAITFCPDIILLDVMMPGESGFDTCVRLKNDGRTNNIPVIFLSASDTLQSRVTGLNGGAVDYITKPFEREEVLARIRIHLRIRQAFEALIAQQQAQTGPPGNVAQTMALKMKALRTRLLISREQRKQARQAPWRRLDGCPPDMYIIGNERIGFQWSPEIEKMASVIIRL